MASITKSEQLLEEDPYPLAEKIKDIPSIIGRITFRNTTPLRIQKGIQLKPFIHKGKPHLVISIIEDSLEPRQERFTVIPLDGPSIVRAYGGEFTMGEKGDQPNNTTNRWLPNIDVSEYQPDPIKSKKNGMVYKAFYHLCVEIEHVPDLKWYGHLPNYFSFVSRNFFDFLDNDPTARSMDILMHGDSEKLFANAENFARVCQDLGRAGVGFAPTPTEKAAMMEDYHMRKRVREMSGRAARVRKLVRTWKGPVAPELSDSSEGESEGDGEGENESDDEGEEESDEGES